MTLLKAVGAMKEKLLSQASAVVSSSTGLAYTARSATINATRRLAAHAELATSSEISALRQEVRKLRAQVRELEKSHKNK